MYSTLKGYFSSSKTKRDAKVDQTVQSAPQETHNNNGDKTGVENGTINPSSVPTTETTPLLGHPIHENTIGTAQEHVLAKGNDDVPPPPPPLPSDTITDSNNNNKDSTMEDIVHPLPQHSPSVYDFYFDKSRNPTVQRYYRFHATPITPIIALHKRPGSSSSSTAMPASSTGGVTGLLRRSAVVPSHGTDHTGDWILVSVGGRSGWARKKQSHQHFSGFTLAEQFRATEGWMGNHAFCCGRGKCMLGSDAPSLVFTNVLIAVGFVWHFVVVLPKLHQLELQGRLPFQLLTWLSSWSNSSGSDYNKEDELDELTTTTPITTTLFWCSFVLGVISILTLWISALMDPGIIPPVSSPVKAPVPTQVPLGGPLGYRYCSTCNIFRPPRSKHCNSCNVCVSKFDQ
jgi:hypothetical protein